MANILVVDDELGIRDLLFEILNDEGHTVELAENAAQARAARQIARPDLVLLDIWMPDTDGVSLLKEWSTLGLLNMPVIMMSGHATIDTAVEATRIGAQAFLEKPITMQKLLKAVETGLQKKTIGTSSTASNSNSNPLYPPQGSQFAASVQGAARSSANANLQGTSAPGAGFQANGPTGALSAFASEFNVGGRGAAYAHPTPETTQAASQLSPTQQVFELDQPLREARDAFEKAYFEFHLVQEGGSMTRVAEKTGLERTHLYRKLKQLGVDLSKTKRSLGH